MYSPISPRFANGNPAATIPRQAAVTPILTTGKKPMITLEKELAD
jgi:hypothetical protein